MIVIIVSSKDGDGKEKISNIKLLFLVLSVIAREDSYGYQISRKIRPVSNAKDST